MAYLLEKRGSGLLVLKGKEYDNGHLSPFFSRELWRWPMPSSSSEEEVCPSSPKKETVETMVIFFHSSVESCGGDHGISSREEGVWPSRSKRERSTTMAMVIEYLLKKRRSALPTPREKGRMTMATFLLSLVKSCEGGHGISSQEGGLLVLFLGRKEG